MNPLELLYRDDISTISFIDSYNFFIRIALSLSSLEQWEQQIMDTKREILSREDDFMLRHFFHQWRKYDQKFSLESFLQGLMQRIEIRRQMVYDVLLYWKRFGYALDTRLPLVRDRVQLFGLQSQDWIMLLKTCINTWNLPTDIISHVWSFV